MLPDLHKMLLKSNRSGYDRHLALPAERKIIDKRSGLQVVLDCMCDVIRLVIRFGTVDWFVAVRWNAVAA